MSFFFYHQVMFHCIYICVYVYIHTTIFIHWSIDGPLYYFHILSIANNAAMNIGECIFSWLSVLGFYRSGISGHKAVVFIFLRTSTFFPIVVAPVYIPTNSALRLPFHILANTCLLTLMIAFLTGVRWYLMV